MGQKIYNSKERLADFILPLRFFNFNWFWINLVICWLHQHAIGTRRYVATVCMQANSATQASFIGLAHWSDTSNITSLNLTFCSQMLFTSLWRPAICVIWPGAPPQVIDRQFLGYARHIFYTRSTCVTYVWGCGDRSVWLRWCWGWESRRFSPLLILHPLDDHTLG